MLKYAFYIIVTLIVAGLLMFSFWSWKRLPDIRTETITHEIVKPVEVRIIERYIEGTVDTVYIDNKPQPVAIYHTKKDTLDAQVDVKVRYFIEQNRFDSDINIKTNHKETVIETTKYVTQKPKLIRVISGVSVGFIDDDGKAGLKNAGLDAGIKLRDKYSVSVFANTDSVFGLRFGIDF